jgi:pimeloyl-ACP methyl ester carboxylesterase
VNENVRQNSYVYSSLDDTFFDPKYGKLGLYNPTELISHTQGFLFGLEEVDPKKALVLFIHGISGTPRDWKFLVEGLDRNRFQPFFFYYPTGLPLDKLGTLLGQIITIISKTPKGRNRPIILAAHSMGGLVALSAIQKLTQEGLPSSLKLFCSFATPYAGDDSARYWGDKAPTMVPAWRDIATGSDFIQDLTRRSITSKLPFYLFFAYHDASTIKNAKNSDGAVTIHSQLNPAIQSAAAKVLGFNETHTGILNSEAARQSFHQLLDSVVPPKHAPIRNHE